MASTSPATGSTTGEPGAMPLAASLPSPTRIRAELEDFVQRDLLGPAGGPDEEIADGDPRDRYLVGMLAPSFQPLPAGEIDALADDSDGSVEDGAADDPGLPADSLFPSSIGLSCTVDGSATAVVVTARWGRYLREDSATARTDKGNPKKVWKRYPIAPPSVTIALVEGEIGAIPVSKEQPEVIVRGLARRLDGDWILSLFLVNGQPQPDRSKSEAWLFQPELEVAGTDSSACFRRRPFNNLDARSGESLYEEQRALAMLYRHRVEFAVGHGVAVEAEVDAAELACARRIVTKVMPVAEVPLASAPTAEDVPALGGVVLDMRALAELPDEALFASLEALPDAYRAWIERERARIANPDAGLRPFADVAGKAITDCQTACERIEAGIALLRGDADALAAFRFANLAMALQRVHTMLSESRRGGKDVTLSELDVAANRSWRPFQLAFVLLNLPGITRLDHPDRQDSASAIADLLWFPTGGGKTEAYLGLTAYTLAIRRLQGVVGGRLGHAGVAVIMRYTLRLLTLQQFQRASALICACEMLRRANPRTWGGEPFRIGLWVGMRTTPNSIEDAHQSLLQGHGAGRGSGTGSPLQLTNCPWCGHEIQPGRDVKAETYAAGRARVITYCGNAVGACEFSPAKSPGEGLPVVTVDEEIYRRLPALVIATVDKFAQMPWNGRTQMLFGQVTGHCPRHGFRSPCIEDADLHPAGRSGQPAVRSVAHGPLRPPDLIIQDELHLISGPLGSLVGLYETAVDQLCSWRVGERVVRPKLIASTATIRQAREQVRSLFLRDVRVFPPPGLDVHNNFFSVQREPSDIYPGRRYVGVCANGRRLKAALIRVYTAYLAASQALFQKYGKAADPWMTVLGYFNSMRELGGMRRLVDDDVRSRLRDTDKRGLAKRHVPMLDELTSRKSSRDIPGLLDRLEVAHDPSLPPHTRGGARGTMPLDVVLATNMVSVGVDIKRLGLMVVGGQPKGTSEYIQATSRVGRNAAAPGIVCTVYNWARPRDLSHYERFNHYHATFYQHVEALSVTPFAARAVDRGLAAVLASLVRLPASQYNDNQGAGRVDRANAIVQSAIDGIARRAAEVGTRPDGDVLRAQLQARLDSWLRRAAPAVGGARLGYRAERDATTVNLLEVPSLGGWSDFTCLTSLRDVEPSIGLLLDERDIDDVPASTPSTGGSA
ncbi:MAG: helicase [Betaproteobacteria bacterium]|nr:MAG: helicase [Betaproteobacteria bacterium]